MIRRDPQLDETNHLVIDYRKVVYGRIWAGLAWPSAKNGGVVVVAEDKVGDIIFKRILAECEAGDEVELLKLAHELKTEFKIQRFYGRESKEHAEYLDYHNKGNIRIEEAPGNSELIFYHIKAILEITSAKRKELHFFDGSELRTYLSVLPDDVSHIKNSDFPLVAALGYVVTALDRYKEESTQKINDFYKKQDAEIKRTEVANL